MRTFAIPSQNVENWVEWIDGSIKGLALLWGDDTLEAERRQLRKTCKFNPSLPDAEKFSQLLSTAALERKSKFAIQLWRELLEYPSAELENSVNRGQMASKNWLIEVLEQTLGERLGTVFILGGWYGVLGSLLLEHTRFSVDRVVSFDVRQEATEVAERLNRHWVENGRKFSASTADIMTMNYDAHPIDVPGRNGTLERIAVKPDLIINTVCEHLERFDEWLARIPTGTRLVLQSNNYYAEETHVNCVDTLEDFVEQVNLSQVLYKGSTPTKNYDRFMVIGLK